MFFCDHSGVVLKDKLGGWNKEENACLMTLWKLKQNQKLFCFSLKDKGMYSNKTQGKNIPDGSISSEIV